MRNSSETGVVLPKTATPRGLKKHDLENHTEDSSNGEHPFWPFNPNDISPLQWWRTMPADHLNDAQHLLLLREAVETVYHAKTGQWCDDAAANIAVALNELPITETTFEVDLSMSRLAISALGSNAAATLVLSHILRSAPLNHPFAKYLSVSWLTLNLRRALNARIKAPATGRETARRYPIDHRAAFYAGDFS